MSVSPNFQAIIECIDKHIKNSNKARLTPPEANQLLEQAGLLPDDKTNSGKPLRIYLREGKLPHAYQIGGRGDDWFIPHSVKNIFTLLNKQYLIWYYINDRFKVVEKVFEGFHNNVFPFVQEPFLVNAAHQYYKGVVIDLVALFGTSNSSKSRFSLYFKDDCFRKEVEVSCADRLREIIEVEKANEINILTNLRDTEFGHFDFKEGTKIKVNFDHFELVKDLYNCAFDIIQLCADKNTRGWKNPFEREDSESLSNLNMLVSSLENIGRK